MQIIVVAVVIIALVAWVVVKNDEMSGLGRNVKAGTLRHPHGKLVRAKATTAIPEEAPLANRIKRSMPFISSVAIIAVCVVLYVCDFTVLGHSSSRLLAALSSTGIVALIIAAEATLRASEDARTFWTYVYALVAGVVCALVVWEVVAAAASMSFSEESTLLVYGIVTCVCYMLGSGACVALLPSKVTFERTFEDGAKRSITVSTRSAAYSAYVAMMEPSPTKED